ncbi:cytochrome bc complex cytochrome b subunit [Pseudolysinimonas kribbensis]|uniref:Cytochrome bc1 complex cytochrome b subunit n=1 Tax=Pseudolysinimonas kribbensis TaxID=433641 RepID=A0ABQ6K2P3_9MICO|nr:cytochrome b N-terminal domain-containing protein [Pseudolysinimonas kribbensis]GMA94574.1 menaquinol-cytochrome c reductase cytochrome b subunit [Pseudolysinimonas kribbensis]
MRGISITGRLETAIGRTRAGRRAADVVSELKERVVPTHWSSLFGVVTGASLATVFISGIVLMFFYVPSSQLVTYHGAYAPLDGATMSTAYRSVLDLSLGTPGGLLLRQVHHWSALLLPVAVTAQLLATFFTGGFRRPRQWAWLVLVLVFVVTLAAGWSGYGLPDDLLAGTGLRIVQGIVVAIPVLGAWASSVLFGGGFPGTIIEHLYPIHLVASAALLALVVVRARMAWRHGPTQFAGPGRSDDVVVGVPILPTGAARAAALGAAVAAVLVLVGATFTIAPIWVYGPSSPSDASAGSQPDWYTGFLDGALRLVPPGWEFEVGGYTVSLAVLVPLAVVGLFLLLLAVYPFLELWAVGDRREHRLLERPRSTPVRTGIGVAGMAFYGALWGAASADIVAVRFGMSLETVVHLFQVLLLAGPVVGFVLAERICIALQKRDREVALHGFETGRIVRMPGGRYVELHRSVDRYERFRLLAVEPAPDVPVRPDRRGRLHPSLRLRAALVHVLFQDRLAPPTRDELAAIEQDERVEELSAA